MCKAWLAIFLALGSAEGSDAGNSEEPLETELVETAGSHLIQIEVSVAGPPDVITRLTPADFKVTLKRPMLGPVSVPGTAQPIDNFEVDAICTAPTSADPAQHRRDEARDVTPPPLPRPVSYLFYFDQAHLTLSGRQRSLDVARDLIEQLVVDGSRAMILSNAGPLSVVEELTGNPTRLLDGLDRLERDRQQFDVFAENEDNRVAGVAERLEDGLSVGTLVGTARNFQFEEVYQADRSLRRLRLALSRFAELETAKAAFYFADTMRSNAGEHYTSFFGAAVLSTPAVAPLTFDNMQAQHAFDKLVNEAVTHGIRFYPVQGRGLVSIFDQSPAQFTGSSSSMNSVRQHDAEQTLYDLAAETGGRAFVRGEPASRIVRRIREDYGCVYVISFTADRVPLDQPLSIVVKARRDDIQIRSRGRVMVQSETRRTATRLLSGFLFERGGEGESELVVRLVPTGYSAGAYSALLQIAVPGTTLAAPSWDLGASLVFRDRVREEVSGRIALHMQGVPAVFEAEVSVKPGPYEIVAVAHETTSGMILSEHLRVDWPDPDARAGTLVPVTLLQPVAAAFSREGVARAHGVLARSELEPLDVGQPVAVLGLVCRGRSQTGRWTLERSVVGSSRVEFPTVEIDLDQERCIQIRDLIPAGSLAPGAYRYETRLLLGDAAFEEAVRQFQAQAPPS